MQQRGKPYVDPKAGTTRVPDDFEHLSVAKQGPDFGCGRCALLTAAKFLGSVRGDATSRTLMRRLGPLDRERIAAWLPEYGLWPKDMRALARAAGLGLRRPLHQSAEQFRSGWPWIAFTRVLFRCGEKAVDDGHYLLVLGHVVADGALVVADSHPANPNVYCVGEECFEAAWSKALRLPWAARLWAFDTG